jgi:lipopolysaccharide transport system ATP-binding protein
MSDPIITVENLSKKYLVGHKTDGGGWYRYSALRDVVGRGVRSFARKTADAVRGRQVIQGDEVEEFWALKEVSFEVERGEVLGIIGRNGAGKSTLLKILSRITEPTEGRVTLRGRVASLLEVGTGFHPELTGRENIFLNGAILGMSRAEIRRKFDEIVAFAEVEKFLDTPVKHYSSGMYVRLAFAVAAHLEPEILVVDEVLAVGDVPFQQKCLGKIGEVSRQEGRTVLFVSHNMGSIASLCGTAMLLQNGLIKEAGPASRVIQSYSGHGTEVTMAEFAPSGNAPSIVGVAVDEDALRRGDFLASIEFDSPYPLRPPVGGIVLYSMTGVAVWGSNARFHPNGNSGAHASSGRLICQSSKIPLAPATYSMSAWLGDWHEDFDEKCNVLSFDFRPEHVHPMRPQPGICGHLDWPAAWIFEPQQTSTDALQPDRPRPEGGCTEGFPGHGKDAATRRKAAICRM